MRATAAVTLQKPTKMNRLCVTSDADSPAVWGSLHPYNSDRRSDAEGPPQPPPCFPWDCLCPNSSSAGRRSAHCRGRRSDMSSEVRFNAASRFTQTVLLKNWSKQYTDSVFHLFFTHPYSGREVCFLQAWKIREWLIYNNRRLHY